MTTEATAEIETPAKRLNRDGNKKRQMRNLIRRGRVWYFKKMVNERLKLVSLGVEDLELAKAKRDKMEQLALTEQWQKIEGPRGQAGTLADVFEKYRQIGGITHKAVGANISSMMTLIRAATGQKELEAAEVKLSVLTPKLVRDYQDNLRAKYQAEAGADEKQRRMARDRADRTSKSTFNQAKSIFSKHGKVGQLTERYREAGILVPDNVKEFCRAGAVGKMSSKVYFPPSDEQMKATFEKVEELRSTDPECYNLFWAALATGCRRNELADMKVEDLVQLDGRRWVGAGLGKDGEQIRIPLIAWTVHLANPRTPASVIEEMLQERKAGYLFLGDKTERYDEMPDRLNGWLFRQGWKDEKKLHGLRAFIGCKIYAKNPRLAQLYMRHKSIATTEKFYAGFLRLQDAFKFDDADPTKPAAVTPAPGPAVPLTIVQTPGQEVAA